jgi:hypothetical protein
MALQDMLTIRTERYSPEKIIGCGLDGVLSVSAFGTYQAYGGGYMVVKPGGHPSEGSTNTVGLMVEC